MSRREESIVLLLLVSEAVLFDYNTRRQSQQEALLEVLTHLRVGFLDLEDIIALVDQVCPTTHNLLEVN